MPARYSPAEIAALQKVSMGKAVDKDELELGAWKKKAAEAKKAGTEPPPRPKRTKRPDKDLTRFELVAYLTEEQAKLLRCGRKRTKVVFCKKRGVRDEVNAFAAKLASEVREALALLGEIEAGDHDQTLIERCRAYIASYAETWDEDKVEREERFCGYVADSPLANVPVALLSVEDVEEVVAAVPEISLARAVERQQAQLENRESGKWSRCAKYWAPLKEPRAAGARTQYDVLRFIRLALDDGVNRGILTHNVARNRALSKRFPSTNRGTNVDPFPSDEVSIIWNHILAMPVNGTRITLMLITALGLRPSEGLGLQWRDVKLDDGRPRIHIVRSRPSQGSRTQAREGGKTPSAPREIPIPASLVDELRRHMAEDKRRCAAAGVRWSSRNWVSTSDDGVNPIWGQTLNNRFKAILKEEGLGQKGMYSLRHSWATENLQNGVPVKTVARLMGHASESVTLSIYAAYVPSSAEDVVGGYITHIEAASVEPLDSPAACG
ncbi:MAG: tyrosine-type recombinase/integrase [Coriobacteriales bacterium]